MVAVADRSVVEGHLTAHSISGESAIQLRGLSKHYGAVHAVRNIDLDVPRGTLFGLIGPDGAGKSSTMKIIAGVMQFDTGRVNVLGVGVNSERTAELVKPRLGFMPQGLGQNLYPDLSIEENINFLARMRQVPNDLLEQRKDKLLKMTRLDKFRKRPMRNLSGGMKQKLGLIGTLIHEPELIILDEPTTGVDPVSRRDFWAILTELIGEQGITALVSTSYMDEASRFHHAALLHDGKIMAVGEPVSLLKLAPGTAVSVVVDPQIDAMERLKKRYHQVMALGGMIRAFVPDQDHPGAEAEMRQALDGLNIKEVYLDTPDLEDVFIAMLHSQGEIVSADKSAPLIAPGGKPMVGEIASGYAIDAVALIRDFGDFRAVDQVSFQVKEGEIFGLLGANGAGKTTVIKMLTGIVPPTGGEGHVAGVDMRRPGREIKQRIGYMSQAFSLYQDLTVTENIRLYGGIYGVPRREIGSRIKWILDLAGLHGYEHALAGSLPMGLRQRLALGCSLVHRPPILFLDEPTSGVDPVGRRQFWDILFALSRQEGVAMLVTTHYMVEAEPCDHLCLMHAGKVVADDSPVGMKRMVEDKYGHLIEIQCADPYRGLNILKQAGYDKASLYGRRIQMLLPDLNLTQPKIEGILRSASITVGSITRLPLTMENVFVEYVLEMERQQLGSVAE